MQKIPKEEIDKLVKKYTSKLEKGVKKDSKTPKKNSEFSREYEKFREESMSKVASRYEKMAKFAGRVISTKPNDKVLPKIKESIELSHLNITPKDVSSFAVFYPLIIGMIFLLGGIVSFVFGMIPLALFLFLFFLICLLFITPLSKFPMSIANRWRAKSGDQLVLCVLYIVIYMRHTSNLENAIKFASDHLGGSVSLDLKKIFWDVEVGKYSTIKESLDNYLRLWREHNLSFVNSIHLIESSLYEPNEERRLTLLDKSLQVILDGVYNNMLHYAHELKNPITMLHMLGVILPILGLVIFPLLGAFLGGVVKWYHLAILYNILLPLLVYSIGSNILAKRPAGYSENLISYKGRKGPAFISILLVFLFIVIGVSPFIFNSLGIGGDPTFLGGPFFDFDDVGGKTYGPYGFGALLLSLFIPLGLGLGIGIYFIIKTKGLLGIRKKVKKLESEFSSGLFQLGTRVGDGIPTERAFKDVSSTMQDTPTGELFMKIHNNLSKLGMTLRDAIFNRERGAIRDFPSPLVESSMEVLIESSKRGPSVVSQSLISISNYVNSVKNVGERLKDLLADIISSMKSQINFMAPVIAGIVVGIGSMITGVISQLSGILDKAAQGQDAITGGLTDLPDLFQKVDTIPSYFFQLVVGIYVVQIIYILTVLANGVEVGADKLNEHSSIGKNMIKSGLLYVIVTLITVLIFNWLATFVLTKAVQ
jgi:hypothetical protein